MPLLRFFRTYFDLSYVGRHAGLIVIGLALASPSFAARPRIHPDARRIQEIFAKVDPAMTGPEGYVLVADKFFSGQMEIAFKYVSLALEPKQFKKLAWGNRFAGNSAQYHAERTRVLEKTGDPVTGIHKYFGPEGCVKYADEFYAGAMLKAFKNVSAVLSEKEFADLGWGNQFVGATAQYRAERTRVLEKTGEPETGPYKYLGPDGYVKYADDFYRGAMLKAFKNVSALLSEKEFADLGWGKAFSGTTTEYRSERTRVLEKTGEPETGPYKYLGPEGYLKYADEFYAGAMLKAFKNVSALLSEKEFADLGWGKGFSGTTTEYRSERTRVLEKSGDPETGPYKYLGPEGYVKYADDFYRGAMQKAFMNVSAVLTEKEFADLGWGKGFSGTTTEYQSERTKVLEKTGDPATGLYKYLGTEGYVKYADDFYAEAMLKAFRNVSAVLSEKEFSNLGWGKAFVGTTKERKLMRTFLSHSNGEIDFGKWFGKADGLSKAVDEYLGTLGFAKPYNQKSRDKVRRQLRAAVTDKEIISLGWGSVTSNKARCEESLN
jgi:hypothetical protein